MNLAFQMAANPPSKRAHSKKQSTRAETLKAMHATWRKVAPPTVVDAEDLRQERLNFATRVLNLKQPLESMSGLSGAQLGRVLDAMRAMEATLFRPPTVDRRPAPVVPGTKSAEVFHLATTAQVEAIDKLFVYLAWSPETTERFIATRFNGKTSHRLLSPDEANRLTMILFNIAAQRRIKLRGFQQGPITRVLIREEIPELKRELGIDQSDERRR